MLGSFALVFHLEMGRTILGACGEAWHSLLQDGLWRWVFLYLLLEWKRIKRHVFMVCWVHGFDIKLGVNAHMKKLVLAITMLGAASFVGEGNAANDAASGSAGSVRHNGRVVKGNKSIPKITSNPAPKSMPAASNNPAGNALPITPNSPATNALSATPNAPTTSALPATPGENNVTPSINNIESKKFNPTTPIPPNTSDIARPGDGDKLPTPRPTPVSTLAPTKPPRIKPTEPPEINQPGHHGTINASPN